MAKGTTLRFVERFKPADKWFEISIFPSTEGLSIFFYDVTDRLAQEKQLRLLETAVARLNDVLIITDAPSATEAANCRIVYVNAAFTHVTGYSRDVAIGGSPRMLQGPQTQGDQLARIREAIQRQKAVQVELINYTRTGAAYWVEMDITPLRDEAGQLTHYVAIQRDISERKAADVEARLQNERFRLAAEATTDVIWDWNIAKGESWWSGAMNAAYQHDSANKGPHRDIWLDNLHPEDRDRVIVGLMRVVE
jgi:PAS domain S-box-containing protein